MKRTLLIVLMVMGCIALNVSAQSHYNGNVTVGGKNYKVVNNKISFGGDMPYKLVLGNIESMDAETKEYILDDIKWARVYAKIIKDWNTYMNAHNSENIKNLYYSQVIKYYASFCDKTDLSTSMNGIFNKYPDYHQYIDNVEIDVNGACINFQKHVKTSTNAKEAVYPSYLNIVTEQSGSTLKGWIIRESDKVTDANVAKKEAAYPKVKLNKRWTVNQLFCGNVNKVLNFQIWDFWNDGDEHEYPLLNKIGFGSGRDSFKGPVYKHFNGRKNIYYCEGTSSGAPGDNYHNAWWHIIWRYNATTGKVEQFSY